MATDFSTTFADKSCMKIVGYDMTKAATAAALSTAGVSIGDVQVVELHDCFSANEVTSNLLSLTLSSSLTRRWDCVLRARRVRSSTAAATLTVSLNVFSSPSLLQVASTSSTRPAASFQKAILLAPQALRSALSSAGNSAVRPAPDRSQGQRSPSSTTLGLEAPLL
jgi:hypothetical protein